MNEKMDFDLFVSKGPIDDKSTLVQVMAWRRTDYKSLHEPMLTQFTDAYMHHCKGMGFIQYKLNSDGVDDDDDAGVDAAAAAAADVDVVWDVQFVYCQWFSGTEVSVKWTVPKKVYDQIFNTKVHCPATDQEKQ